MRFRIALQKGLTVLAIAKSFSAADAGRGEAGTHIAVFEAVLNVRSMNEFVQESCVETVTCPNSVDGLNEERSSMKPLIPAFGERASLTALDDNDGNEA